MEVSTLLFDWMKEVDAISPREPVNKTKVSGGHCPCMLSVSPDAVIAAFFSTAVWCSVKTCCEAWRMALGLPVL